LAPFTTTNEQIASSGSSSDTVPSQSLPVLSCTYTPQALFDNILNTFERRFDQEQWLGFKTTSAGSLKRLLKKIQDEQKASKSIQNLRRMECLLNAIENIGKIMEEALSMSDILCYIWGPAKLLLQVTASESLFALVMGFEW
jgi:hypothetical protein